MVTEETQFSDLDHQLEPSDTGDIDIVKEARAIEQSFINILMTQKGERVLRPNFGTDFRRAVFDLNDSTSDGFIRSQVRSAEKQEPRIHVQGINIQRSGNTKRVQVVWGSPVLNQRQMITVLI